MSKTLYCIFDWAYLYVAYPCNLFSKTFDGSKSLSDLHLSGYWISNNDCIL